MRLRYRRGIDRLQQSSMVKIPEDSKSIERFRRFDFGFQRYQRTFAEWDGSFETIARFGTYRPKRQRSIGLWRNFIKIRSHQCSFALHRKGIDQRAIVINHDHQQSQSPSIYNHYNFKNHNNEKSQYSSFHNHHNQKNESTTILCISYPENYSCNRSPTDPMYFFVVSYAKSNDQRLFECVRQCASCLGQDEESISQSTFEYSKAIVSILAIKVFDHDFWSFDWENYFDQCTFKLFIF